jgi:hypothetical protein
MIPDRLMRAIFSSAGNLLDEGGAFGFAGAGVGYGYVTNRMLGFDDVDPRRKVLIDAVYDAL